MGNACPTSVGELVTISCQKFNPEISMVLIKFKFPSIPGCCKEANSTCNYTL